MDEKHLPADDKLSQLLLLVAADDLFAVAVTPWLARRGWQVTRARPGVDAGQLRRDSGIHLALVDLDGDTLGALGLLSAARAVLGDVRAVVSTREPAAARLPEAVRRRLGIAEVLVRPFHISTLCAALDRARGGGEAPSSQEAL